MKVVTIVGIRGSGKTTVTETLIRGLRSRGYRVGSVKSIGCGNNCELRKNGVCGCSGGAAHGGSFSIDKVGSNSHRHRAAGSQLVTTLAEAETAVMFQEALPLDRLLGLYVGYDYVILEGDYGAQVPRIVTAWEAVDANDRITPLTFLVSGRLASTEGALVELPVIDPIQQPERLVDYVVAKLCDHLLPDHCPHCGQLCSGNV